MQLGFKIVQNITGGLLIGMFLAASVSCQSADVRSTSQ